MSEQNDVLRVADVLDGRNVIRVEIILNSEGFIDKVYRNGEEIQMNSRRGLNDKRFDLDEDGWIWIEEET